MSEHPETIVIAGNVEVPAYLAVQSLGYSISRDKGASEQEWWSATCNSSRFVATNPLELLGLIAMRHERGPNWKAEDQEIDAYLAMYYPEGLPKSD